jgi:carboxyvinyl-carboxyphosphonate phosphorylmutase
LEKKTTAFRRLLNKPGIIVAPGVFDAFIAKIVEEAGFDAAYMTGSGTAAAMRGLPDVGLLTMTEMVMNARHIADTINIPLIADIDTGYGNAINAMHTVKEFIKAGAAAAHMEDQVAPKRCGHWKGKRLIATEEMVGKIKAADEIRKELDPDFVIIARTDSRGALGGSLEEAIKRGKAYVRAGADMILLEAPESAEEIRSFARNVNVHLMIGIIEGGVTPILSAKELEDLGCKVVIFPNAALRVVHKNVMDLMNELKKTGTTKNFLDRMLLFPAFHDLVGKEHYRQLEEKFLEKTEVEEKYKKTIGF